jgi:hypothetical protein
MTDETGETVEAPAPPAPGWSNTTDTVGEAPPPPVEAGDQELAPGWSNERAVRREDTETP